MKTFTTGAHLTTNVSQIKQILFSW